MLRILSTSSNKLAQLAFRSISPYILPRGIIPSPSHQIQTIKQTQPCPSCLALPRVLLYRLVSSSTNVFHATSMPPTPIPGKYIIRRRPLVYASVMCKRQKKTRNILYMTHHSLSMPARTSMLSPIGPVVNQPLGCCHIIPDDPGQVMESRWKGIGQTLPWFGPRMGHLLHFTSFPGP